MAYPLVWEVKSSKSYLLILYKIVLITSNKYKTYSILSIIEIIIIITITITHLIPIKDIKVLGVRNKASTEIVTIGVGITTQTIFKINMEIETIKITLGKITQIIITIIIKILYLSLLHHILIV